MSMILNTTDTESSEFVPGGEWALAVDIYVNDVVVQWKSPEDVWVDLMTFDSVGYQVARCIPGKDAFRVTTSSAGSRAFLIVPTYG